jgi:hypothetical protein
MPVSVLASFIEKFTGGLLRTAFERWVDGVIVVAAALTPWILGKRAAFWEGALYVTVVVCLLLGGHVVRAAREVWVDISTRPIGHFVESDLYSINNKKESTFVPDPYPSYFRQKLIIIGLVSIGLLTLPILIVKHYSASASKEASPPVIPSPPAPEVPTVEATYTTQALPLVVVPKMTVYVLQIHSKLTQLLAEQTLTNTNPKNNLLYPQSRMKSSEHSPMDLYLCKIQNHGNKDLVDVRIKFHISVRQLIKVRETFAKNNTTKSVQVHTDHVTSLHWTWFDNGHTVEYADGEETTGFDRWVVIPSINAHQMEYIYLVNKCNLPIRFDLPTKGVAVISGQSSHQEITFIRPVVAVPDVFPLWFMPPARYKWGLLSCN